MRFRLYIDADVKFKGYFVEDAAFVGWTRFVRKYLPPLHPRYVEDVIERNTRKRRMHVVELFGGDISEGRDGTSKGDSGIGSILGQDR